MTEKKDTKGFEASLERLEAIVEGMESGNLDLDQLIKDFEEGQKLITVCSKKLNEVEKRIEKLVKGADGEVSAEPFAD